MSSVRENFGLCCPRCGDDDRLMVEIRTMARLRRDGTETVGDHAWGLDSACGCTDCDYWATVSSFTVTEGGQP